MSEFFFYVFVRDEYDVYPFFYRQISIRFSTIIFRSDGPIELDSHTKTLNNDLAFNFEPLDLNPMVILLISMHRE